MKISKTTLDMLKNFSTINASISVAAGSELKTLSPQNNIMASAKINEEFKTPFAIYDLSQFLGAVSLFGEEPEFEFNNKYVNLSAGRRSLKYYFADPSMVKSAGDKKIKLPSADVSFKLSEKQLSEILKAASVLSLTEIAILSSGDGELTHVVAVDSKNATSNSFNVEVDHTSESKFNLIFKSENLKMISGDYDVEVSSKGISRFFCEALDVEYFIAIESSSGFG